MFLAGDVGGTKTHLALYAYAAGGLEPIRDAIFPSRAFPSLEAIIQHFLLLGSTPPLRSCCFGVAGPVVEGHCRTTNLPWALDEHELARASGAAVGKLLNDLEAAAYGMLHLRPDEFCSLSTGNVTAGRGNMAVIAAGTGLGEAILFWDGRRYHPVASEGGHCDFAPRSALEIELLRFLMGRHQGHVSCERVLSGPGLYNIYEFFRDTGRYAEPPALRARMQTADPNAIIAEAALKEYQPLCTATLELFASIYGAEAGNLALKCMATGGVLIGGGIAPKILPALLGGHFFEAFIEKGRFVEFLRRIPVRVALNPNAPLLGAAWYACHLPE